MKDGAVVERRIVFGGVADGIRPILGAGREVMKFFTVIGVSFSNSVQRSLPTVVSKTATGSAEAAGEGGLGCGFGGSGLRTGIGLGPSHHGGE